MRKLIISWLLVVVVISFIVSFIVSYKKLKDLRRRYLIRKDVYYEEARRCLRDIFIEYVNHESTMDSATLEEFKAEINRTSNAIQSLSNATEKERIEFT